MTRRQSANVPAIVRVCVSLLVVRAEEHLDRSFTLLLACCDGLFSSTSPAREEDEKGGSDDGRGGKAEAEEVEQL